MIVTGRGQLASTENKVWRFASTICTSTASLNGALYGAAVGRLASLIQRSFARKASRSGLSSGSGTATGMATALGLTIRGSAPISLCSLKIQRSSAAWRDVEVATLTPG